MCQGLSKGSSLGSLPSPSKSIERFEPRSSMVGELGDGKFTSDHRLWSLSQPAQQQAQGKVSRIGRLPFGEPQVNQECCVPPASGGGRILPLRDTLPLYSTLVSLKPLHRIFTRHTFRHLPSTPWNLPISAPRDSPLASLRPTWRALNTNARLGG